MTQPPRRAQRDEDINVGQGQSGRTPQGTHHPTHQDYRGYRPHRNPQSQTSNANRNQSPTRPMTTAQTNRTNEPASPRITAASPRQNLHETVK